MNKLTVHAMKTKHLPRNINCTVNREQNRSLQFFHVKREKVPATDEIKCKHENGLKLSITFLNL